MDLHGIAEIIVALGITIPSIIGAVQSYRNGSKIAEVHELVNGQSAKLNAMAEAKGFVEGGNEERARPTPAK
jgi:hypothetical protein